MNRPGHCSVAIDTEKVNYTAAVKALFVWAVFETF